MRLATLLIAAGFVGHFALLLILSLGQVVRCRTDS
jgi:hypothetical protein